MDYEKELQKERDRRIAAELEVQKLKQTVDEYRKFFNTLKLFMERVK